MNEFMTHQRYFLTACRPRAHLPDDTGCRDSEKRGMLETSSARAPGACHGPLLRSLLSLLLEPERASQII